MADYYFDSSALVKRYVNEIGSPWVCGLFDPSLGHEAFIAAITPWRLSLRSRVALAEGQSPRLTLSRLVLSFGPTSKPVIRLSS